MTLSRFAYNWRSKAEAGSGPCCWWAPIHWMVVRCCCCFKSASALKSVGCWCTGDLQAGRCFDMAFSKSLTEVPAASSGLASLLWAPEDDEAGLRVEFRSAVVPWSSSSSEDSPPSPGSFRLVPVRARTWFLWDTSAVGVLSLGTWATFGSSAVLSSGFLGGSWGGLGGPPLSRPSYHRTYLV